MDDSLLNDEDHLAGEQKPSSGGDSALSSGSASDEPARDDEMDWNARQEKRWQDSRGKERKRELRDARAVRLILQSLGPDSEETEEQLKKLRGKKLRERAKAAGVDEETLKEMFKEEDEKDWKAVVAALKRLVEEAQPERRMIGVATVALIVDTIMGLAIPRFFGLILDTATATSGAGCDTKNSSDTTNVEGAAMSAITHDRGTVTLSLVVVIIIASICGCARDILFSVAGQRVVLRLRKRLFTHMLTQDVGFFDKTKSGELVNRLSADVMMLKSAVETAWAQFLSCVMSLIATLVYLFFVSWKLTLIMMATPPIIILCGASYGAYLERVAKATQDVLARAADSASESISGVRTVRAFANEQSRISAYIANVQRSYELGVKVAVAGGIFGAFMSCVVSCAIGFILYYGAGLVVSGEMTPGGLTSYLIYCMVLTGSIGGLAGTYGSVMMAAGANRRVFELLDAPPPAIPLEEGEYPSPASSMACSLDFRDVCFSYPTRPDQSVLKGVSFSIQAGQKVALVGKSGCGKSTIINLIMRFYDPMSGAIELGGRPLTSLAPKWLHTHFGLVAQEPLLFGMTVAENIGFGAGEEDGEDERLRAEAAVAEAVPEPAPPLASLRQRFGGGRLSRGRQQTVGPSTDGDNDGMLVMGDGGGDSVMDALNSGGMGGRKPLDEKVIAAAKMANAHEFIEAFEDG